MDHPILLLPPPEPPAPENPPEKAPPESHTYNDSAMSNFRALMMKMAIESSPSKSLTPTQTLILEDKLRQCFPYLRAPDHPPYAWMITTAIKQLNEEGGSSEEAISECIMNDNHDLPWAHSTLLKHHLVKLCEKREIVQTRDGLYVLNDRIASVPRVSIPSNPSEFFDSTASPSCSLSISLTSDSSSDSLYGGSSRRKGKRRRRKLKKARNTRKGRQQKGSARRGNNIHLKRKRKVQRRPPKKGKWQEEISSDEEMEDELLDIMLEEGMAVIRAENQLNEQKVTVEEELHPSEDINEDGKQPEMQETTNISPCESDRLDDNTQINAKIDVMEVQNPVVNEKMEVDIREQDLMQEDKQQEMQKKLMSSSCEKDSGEIPIPMNEGDAQNPVFEARTDDIESQNEQKEQETMNGRSPLGLEHNANQLEMNAETKAMELQEGTVVIEEQNQSKQLEVNEEEPRDNQQEVRGEKNTGEENFLLKEQKLLEELHPLEEAKQGGNQPEMLEVSPSIPREEDSRHEIIQTNEDIEVIEVKDCDLEEQITGNPAQKEQEVMEESHQSPKMEIEDKQEDMDEKKRDWACEKDVLSQEREARDLLLSDVDEGEHQPMQLDVMLKEENLLLETNDQLENANLVNDTKFQEMVDEGLKKHGCQEISHSPKNSSFLDEEQGMQHNKDFQLVNIQQSIQTEAEIIQDQNTEEINVLETTNEPEEGRCLRSGRKMKSGQKHEAVETSTGSEAPAHEETIDIKLNDQQEQETVACEEQNIEKAKMGMVDDPYIVCSSDEVEEIRSPLQQNNEVSSEEEEQQELPFSEDTKQEQLSQRQLRPRVPKTEPDTQEHRIPQVVLSLEATRGVVTRGMAAATALDEQAPQQRKKRVKSQVGEISRMPRRSTRLSLGQSKKRVSRRRT